MRQVTLAHEVDWETWRTNARTLALDNIPPEQTLWSVGQPDDLFADAPAPPSAEAPKGTFTVPRALVTLAETAIQHSDPERFALLYGLVWRAHAGEKHILELTSDPDVQRVNRLAQSVRRDTHKMHAFVRFREVPEPEGTRHVAWFEPEHYIVETNAAFFIRRFATMTWSILTPYRSIHWNGEAIHFDRGATRADIPDDDALADYWRTYYRSIFNPARLKIGAMTSEMPKKYWRNLPEAAEIPDLIRTAAARTETMVATPTFSAPKPTRAHMHPEPTPASNPLAQAAQDIHACRRCPLWEPATQPVFGEGPADARIMFVGEQPGDQEDLAGRPFVGPAGQLFDRAMQEAGLDRQQVYVTNSVKHFKFVPRGKRRIHEKPGVTEIKACNVWLDIERQQIRPALTVMMGATAARAVTGRAVAITKERGHAMPLPMSDGSNAQGYITVHPSYLLRLPDEESKAREYALFIQDLRNIAALVA